MLCCFLSYGIIFGIINSYGSLYIFLKEYYSGDPNAISNATLVGSLSNYSKCSEALSNVSLMESGDPEASSKAALVGSLSTGTTFLLSTVSSLLIDKYGIQKTAFTGAVLAFLGMLLSAFAVNKVSLEIQADPV